MKFVRARKSEGGKGAATFTFHLSRRDKHLLLSILKLFPATDAQSHRLSRDENTETKSSQEWLVEAMTEQRRDHTKRIEALCKNEGQLFRATDEGLQLVLNGEQMEWLLQALNDVRVGSWARLGCPEMPEARRAVSNEESAAHYTAMEVSGYFQSAILEAFQTDGA